MARIGDPRSIFIDVNFAGFPASSINFTLLSGALDAHGLVFVRPSPAAVQTSAGTVVTGIPNNVIRIGCSGSNTTTALVFEESRKNVVPHARNAAGTGWTAGTMSVTQSIGNGPDGILTATRFTRTGSNNFSHYVNNISQYNGEQWVATLWCKSALDGPCDVEPTIGGLALSTRPLVVNSGSWTKFELTGAYGGTNNYFQPQNGSIESTRVFDIDMMQYEVGLFPTEFVWSSGSATTRASERLFHPRVEDLVDNGMLSIELQFRPKGQFPEQYTEPARLWTIDENNYCEFDITGSLIRVVADGVSATTTNILDTNVGELLILYTSISKKPSEDMQLLGQGSNDTEPSNLGNMFPTFRSLRLPSTLTGSLYFLSDANGRKVMSSWVERISVYRRARNVPDIELPSTRHPNYRRTGRIRPFNDRRR